MNRLQKLDVLFFTFCLLSVEVLSLNYYYSGVPARYRPVPQESAPSAAIETSTAAQNATARGNLRKPGVPYTIFYPLTFPQSRGGRNLNLTLITESPEAEKAQPRILNRPDLYPFFSVPQLTIDNFPSTFPSASQQRHNSSNDDAATNRNAPVHQPKSIDPPTVIEYVSPDRVEEPDVPNSNFRQPKGTRYSSPPRINKLPDTIHAPEPPPRVFKTTNLGYEVPPSRLYEEVVEEYDVPPPQQGSIQNWPCFCVPYYLCKNGVINSGGRSVSAIRRRARSPSHNSKNGTYAPYPVQAKVMNAVVLEQVYDSIQCEGRKVCCRLSFGDDARTDDELYYPVATPPPDPYYPVPPMFPDTRNDPEICGVQRAYGIQGRLKQLQYSPDVAEFGEYPWQAAVLRKVEGQKSLYLCGGVLISPLWVATAAHCVKKEEFSPLLIRLGEWDVHRKDEVFAHVEKDADAVVLHPDFRPDTLYNDVALIRMHSPVDPRIPHVTPACLPRRGTVYQDGKCWVSGWGKDFFGPQGEYQNVLKEVDVPVIGRTKCTEQLRSSTLGPDFNLHPGFLCAGGEAGKDACTGDGGSPLVCKSGQSWYVVGLVSWGIGCGQPGVPGVYVNMLYYMDWIDSIIWR